MSDAPNDNYLTEPRLIDETQFQTCSGDELKELQAKAKPYFGLYMQARITEKPGVLAAYIKSQLINYAIVQQQEILSQETYLFRKVKEDDKAKAIYDKLMILRRFWLEFFDVEPPKWELVQDEYHDDLKVLQNQTNTTEAQLQEFCEAQNIMATAHLRDFEKAIKTLGNAEIEHYLHVAFEELKGRMTKANQEEESELDKVD